MEKKDSNQSNAEMKSNLKVYIDCINQKKLPRCVAYIWVISVSVLVRSPFFHLFLSSISKW